MTDIEILRVLVDEHEANIFRDASYAALNSDILDEPEDKVEQATLFFIERLICDGVISSEKLLLMAAGYFDPHIHDHY